mmetsp:Transcript_5173/g.15418  ORF Transcript_5173/g.15418 Transcript_5173/m.15418 type:complete len:445 (+) Transcript_5173:4614-5948(+)
MRDPRAAPRGPGVAGGVLPRGRTGRGLAAGSSQRPSRLGQGGLRAAPRAWRRPDVGGRRRPLQRDLGERRQRGDGPQRVGQAVRRRGQGHARPSPQPPARVLDRAHPRRGRLPEAARRGCSGRWRGRLAPGRRRVRGSAALDVRRRVAAGPQGAAQGAGAGAGCAQPRKFAFRRRRRPAAAAQGLPARHAAHAERVSPPLLRPRAAVAGLLRHLRPGARRGVGLLRGPGPAGRRRQAPRAGARPVRAARASGWHGRLLRPHGGVVCRRQVAERNHAVGRPAPPGRPAPRRRGRLRAVRAARQRRAPGHGAELLGRPARRAAPDCPSRYAGVPGALRGGRRPLPGARLAALDQPPLRGQGAAALRLVAPAARALPGRRRARVQRPRDPGRPGAGRVGRAVLPAAAEGLAAQVGQPRGAARPRRELRGGVRRARGWPLPHELDIAR